MLCGGWRNDREGDEHPRSAFRPVLEGDLAAQIPGAKAVYQFHARAGVLPSVKLGQKARPAVTDFQASHGFYGGQGEIDVALAMLDGIADQFVNQHRERRSLSHRHSEILYVELKP